MGVEIQSEKDKDFEKEEGDSIILLGVKRVM